MLASVVTSRESASAPAMSGRSRTRRSAMSMAGRSDAAGSDASPVAEPGEAFCHHVPLPALVAATMRATAWTASR